jgi:predicted nucleic acid-binding protein
MQAVADTGLIKALLDRNDPHHAWAAEVFPKHAPWLTCEAVLAEAAHLTGAPQLVMRLVEDTTENAAFFQPGNRSSDWERTRLACRFPRPRGKPRAHEKIHRFRSALCAKGLDAGRVQATPAGGCAPRLRFSDQGNGLGPCSKSAAALTSPAAPIASVVLPIGAFVYRLGHGPLKAERRVRFPYALPLRSVES